MVKNRLMLLLIMMLCDRNAVKSHTVVWNNNISVSQQGVSDSSEMSNSQSSTTRKEDQPVLMTYQQFLALQQEQQLRGKVTGHIDETVNGLQQPISASVSHNVLVSAPRQDMVRPKTTAQGVIRGQATHGAAGAGSTGQARGQRDVDSQAAVREEAGAEAGLRGFTAEAEDFPSLNTLQHTADIQRRVHARYNELEDHIAQPSGTVEHLANYIVKNSEKNSRNSKMKWPQDQVYVGFTELSQHMSNLMRSNGF